MLRISECARLRLDIPARIWHQALVNCASCGSELSSAAKFCPECGKPVSAASTAAVIPVTKRKQRKFPIWLLTIAIMVIVRWVTEHLFSAESLKAADNYIHEQVANAGAFHVSGLFFKHLEQVYAPPPPRLIGIAPEPSPSPSNNSPQILPALFGAWWHTIKTIVHEGPLTAITGIVALAIGFIVTFNPRRIHFMVTLLFAPLVGSVLVYLLLLVMSLAGEVLGMGAETVAYFIAPFPLLRECWAAIFEERQHHFVGALVKRLTRRVAACF